LKDPADQLACGYTSRYEQQARDQALECAGGGGGGGGCQIRTTLEAAPGQSSPMCRVSAAFRRLKSEGGDLGVRPKMKRVRPDNRECVLGEGGGPQYETSKRGTVKLKSGACYQHALPTNAMIRSGPADRAKLIDALRDDGKSAISKAIRDLLWSAWKRSHARKTSAN